MLFITIVACDQKQEGTYPEYAKLVESVYASVTVEPEGYYKVYASAGGIIEELKVEEGSTVQYGDTLLTLRNNSVEYQKRNAAIQLDMAKDNFEGNTSLINDLKQNLEIAKLAYQNDSINFSRQRVLWHKQIGSKYDLEQKELRFLSAKNKVMLLESELARKEDELNKAWQTAQNIYTANLSMNDEFVVRSKVEGKIYELLKEQGESVSPQEPIAFIGSHERFVLQLQVDEVDIVRIRKDQKVWVSLDAYENKVFEARIQSLTPKLNDQSQTFWVEAVFVKQPDVLYSGLRGEANIVIQEKPRTLVIPRAYLNEDKQIETEDGLISPVLGMKSLDKVEVLEGVDSTTYILRPQ